MDTEARNEKEKMSVKGVGLSGLSTWKGTMWVGKGQIKRANCKRRN